MTAVKLQDPVTKEGLGGDRSSGSAAPLPCEVGVAGVQAAEQAGDLRSEREPATVALIQLRVTRTVRLCVRRVFLVCSGSCRRLCQSCPTHQRPRTSSRSGSAAAACVPFAVPWRSATAGCPSARAGHLAEMLAERPNGFRVVPGPVAPQPRRRRWLRRARACGSARPVPRWSGQGSRGSCELYCEQLEVLAEIARAIG